MLVPASLPSRPPSAMDNSKFYDEAITIVKEAIEADQKKDWEKALGLYLKALDRFQSGLKCEQGMRAHQGVHGESVGAGLVEQPTSKQGRPRAALQGPWDPLQP